MATMGTAEGRVVALKRLRNSERGNPAWRITLEDGRSFRTAANTFVGFEVWHGLVGAYVELTTNGRGAVIAFRCAFPIAAGE